MITHFDEIKEELNEFHKDERINRNVVLLLWIPRLYKIIKNKLEGEELKIGFLDSYNLADKEVSIVNISTSSQVIDFLNFAKQFNCQNVIGVGLAGAYKLGLGTLFIPKEAVSEEKLTSYFTDNRIGVFSEELFRKNEEIIKKFSENNNTSLELGKTVSLDLFSRETKEFVKEYSTKVDSIDLEVAPLYIISNLLNINCFAILLISDNLDRSYFLREKKEISIIHNLYDQIPELIKSLRF